MDRLAAAGSEQRRDEIAAFLLGVIAANETHAAARARGDAFGAMLCHETAERFKQRAGALVDAEVRTLIADRVSGGTFELTRDDLAQLMKEPAL